MATHIPCCFPGGDAWSREARRLCALAAEQGFVLAATLLIYGDVHDLRAWRDALERHHARSIWHRLAGPRAVPPHHHLRAARP